VKRCPRLLMGSSSEPLGRCGPAPRLNGHGPSGPDSPIADTFHTRRLRLSVSLIRRLLKRKSMNHVGSDSCISTSVESLFKFRPSNPESTRETILLFWVFIGSCWSHQFFSFLDCEISPASVTNCSRSTQLELGRQNFAMNTLIKKRT
jgi:hypothetical protein